MIGRALRTLSLVWITGWLFTWALDVKGEYEHREEYSITLPTGERQLDTARFASAMIQNGIGLFVFWPFAVYIEIGCRLGMCSLNYKQS